MTTDSENHGFGGFGTLPDHTLLDGYADIGLPEIFRRLGACGAISRDCHIDKFDESVPSIRAFFQGMLYLAERMPPPKQPLKSIVACSSNSENEALRLDPDTAANVHEARLLVNTSCDVFVAKEVVSVPPNDTWSDIQASLSLSRWAFFAGGHEYSHVLQTPYPLALIEIVEERIREMRPSIRRFPERLFDEQSEYQQNFHNYGPWAGRFECHAELLATSMYPDKLLSSRLSSEAIALARDTQAGYAQYLNMGNAQLAQWLAKQPDEHLPLLLDSRQSTSPNEFSLRIAEDSYYRKWDTAYLETANNVYLIVAGRAYHPRTGERAPIFPISSPHMSSIAHQMARAPIEDMCISVGDRPIRVRVGLAPNKFGGSESTMRVLPSATLWERSVRTAVLFRYRSDPAFYSPSDQVGRARHVIDVVERSLFDVTSHYFDAERVPPQLQRHMSSQNTLVLRPNTGVSGFDPTPLLHNCIGALLQTSKGYSIVQRPGSEGGIICGTPPSHNRQLNRPVRVDTIFTEKPTAHPPGANIYASPSTTFTDLAASIHEKHSRARSGRMLARLGAMEQRQLTELGEIASCHFLMRYPCAIEKLTAKLAPSTIQPNLWFDPQSALGDPRLAPDTKGLEIRF